jgi:hypothetical protein
MNHYLKRVFNNNLNMNTTDNEVSARSYIFNEKTEIIIPLTYAKKSFCYQIKRFQQRIFI